MTKRKLNTNSRADVSTSALPPWIELPRDVIANILQRLDAIEILESAQKVCLTWRTVCKKDPTMWRVINIRYRDFLIDLNLVCRRVVDLSQGQLTDIHMEDINDQTLHYVCKRSLHLKRLSLASVNIYDISNKALIRAIKKLPLLQELRLVEMRRIFPRHVKKIGNSCPMLKSFSFNLPGRRPPLPYESEDDYGFEDESESDDDFDEESEGGGGDFEEESEGGGSDFEEESDDEGPTPESDGEFEEESYDEGPAPEYKPYLGSKCYALTIAESMPNLHHLQLFANNMKNDGVEALLNGCQHLESLDIRQCYRVELTDVLWQRCLQQIKNLKLPYTSVDDYEGYTGPAINNSCNFYDDDYEI